MTQVGEESLRARVERALDARSQDHGVLTRTNEKITIAVPDATRPLDHHATLAPLLERLADHHADITIIVALGLHRQMTASEMAPLAELSDRFGATLIQSDPHAGGDAGRVICVEEDVGYELEGVEQALPACFDRAVVEADRIICTGLVEPHQYAGFSGGVKTISIGCAGAQTISAMHGLPYLRHPNTRLGQLEGNAFRGALRRLVRKLPPILALQVVPCEDPVVTFGVAEEAFERAASSAARELFVGHKKTYPWVALPVPAVKATNVYQSSRAASYVALASHPVIEQGGWLLIEAACEEGMGEGNGERAFASALERGREVLWREFQDVRYLPALRGGQQRAYVFAQVLSRFRMAWIGAPALEVLAAWDIPQFATREEAIDALGLDVSKGLVARDVFHRVPVLTSS